jgi:hypothetical protein
MRTLGNGSSGGRREAVLREPISVESNTQKEAARAIEMLHVQLISAVIDPYAWKWVIHALHHSVHAFLVASLAADDDGGPAESKSDGPSLRVYPHRSPSAIDTRETELVQIFARVKAATGFRPAEDVDPDIARLAQYRDALFGQVAARWTLRVGELPGMTRNCLRIVEHLGWNPGHITWRRENLTDLARVKYLASVKILEALGNQYRTAA